MRKIYRIKLTSDERVELETIVKKKKVAAAKFIKAQALLLADESDDGEALRDPQIVKATGIKPITLERLRKRCCEVGPLKALERKQRATPARANVLDGEREAKLIA